MKYSKRIIAASAAGIIGVAGIGASAMAASSPAGSSSSSYPDIVQKLASTFGLDPAKVNDVFKQERTAGQTDRDAKLKTTLDQAVKDGKLTQDQETKLIAELKTLRDQIKDDKQQNRQDLKTQLDAWAAANGITNLDQIMPAPPAGGHSPMGPMDGQGPDSSSTISN